MITKLSTAAVFLLTALFASAESFWDGSAALQLGDSSFESGYFAASNSFSANTEVSVRNLETGKTTDAIVTRRITEQSNLLVLLSPKAAAAIGIPQGRIAAVRVTVKSGPPTEADTLPKDLPYSPDPDINPAAGIPKTAISQPTPGTAQTPVETPQGTLESLSQTVAPKTERTAQLPPPAEAPAPVEQTAPSTPNVDLLQQLASRTPQKLLFLPPREDPKFVYQAPAETTALAAPSGQLPEQPKTAAAAPVAAPATETTPPASETATVNGLEQPAVPATEKPGINLAEAGSPPELTPEVEDRISAATSPHEAPALSAPTVPQQPPATELSNPTPTPPQPSDAQTVVTLEPTAPKPPPPAPEPQKPSTETPAATSSPTPPEPQKPSAEAPVVAARPTPAPAAAAASTPAPPKGAGATYYLQLGVYANEKLAREIASSLSASYPVNIVSPEAAKKPVYKILLGPLNKAESGTLLFWFRNRGFSDAFLKTAE
jgi:hypothetical protein